MSKSSTASTSKPLPKQSAWSRGPPQSSAPSPRSQSPAPPTPTHPTHSRRPSALGQGVSIKDGVSVPRNNVGSVKQGSSVTFGSIDDVSASISTSPAATPPTIKSEGVKSFGSVPATAGHVNGKASISSRPTLAPSTASSSSASTPSVSTPTTPSKPLMNKMDVSKLFQNPSSAPPTQPPSDTSSPAMRPSSLPPTSQTPSSQPQSQLAHSFTPFVPSGMRPPPSGGGPPRSPIYPRPMVNGNGPRSQNGPNTPAQVNAALGSPRMAPGPHPGQPNTMPPQGAMQPPVQPPMMPWGGYYYPPPAPDQQQYMYGPPGWYGVPPQPGHPPHHPPPGGHGPAHPGITMSPRTQPPPLQGPGTPTQAHAVPVPHVSVPLPSHAHAPSNSVSSITSPPATPASATHPGTGRLNANSNAFVPSSRKPINIKTADGHEVKIDSLAKPTSGTPAPTPTSTFRQGSPSATPPRRPASVRIETEEQQKLRRIRLENEERQKREQEEKERKEKEQQERRRQEAEEKEQKRKEDEEKERIRQEGEKERLRKEEEAAKEKERKRKEEEEKERIHREAEEKERLKKEEEEKARIRKEEEEKEKERKRLEEEEEKERQRLAEEAAAAVAAEQARLKEEEEKERLRQEEEEAAKAKAAAEQEAQAKVDEAKEDGEIVESKEERAPTPPVPAREEIKEKVKESLRINTATVSSPLAEGHRRRPGALDLTLTKNHVPAPLPSALATARNIDNINSVQYPEGIQSPKAELNTNAKDGKFRYDREFLLQFMALCKEKPAMLPPLDAIGLEPVDQSSLSMSRGGSGRHNRQSASAISRSGSIGLGFSPSQSFNKPGSASTLSSMGQFTTFKPSGEDRFHTFTAGRVVSAPGPAFASNRGPSSMQRTPSQGGPGAPSPSNRTRSKRGDKRPDGKGSQQQSHGSSFGSQTPTNLQGGLEPVAPLQATANRWDRKAIAGGDPDSPELVERKVKGLLNKLTMEKFDSISDQIIDWANKSEKEKDGRTLIQVIKLVFEKATDEATWSEMYARLCRKMMEQISSKVQDDGIKNTEGKPIAGGQLFRKYLLNRCQEDFERGWVAKEAAVAAAANKAAEDKAAKAANEKSKDEGADEVALYSEEYYTLQKAKRQGLGLIKFIGELFKLQMLTERIMHECVKKLLGNVENPEEEEIESLCKLLTTVGQSLDTPKARAHMDVYFSRMKELTKSGNVSPRMQFMLQDILELRSRQWHSRNAVAAPSTLAQVHEAAAKEKAALEKEAMHRQLSMSRGGSRRGGERGDPQVGPDGWTLAGAAAPRPPAKVGDLSNFGKISKGAPMNFRPSGVFAGKESNKRESLSRTSSSSNMFSMLSQSEASADTAATSTKGAPEPPQQRRRLILQPRSKPVDEPEPEATSATSAGPAETNEANEMSDETAKKKIDEDVKEFFAIRNLEEAEVYFTGLPAAHHDKLIDKLASKAIEAKEADAKLVADLLSDAMSKSLCSASAVEEGLKLTAEILYDVAIDAPKAPDYFASWVKSAQLDPESCSRLAALSSDNDALLLLLS
ncbi:hypothetical protein BDN72DRAFT_788870 [Pluteus cervinus]|uniref:Uncharacterized protein n=1 Tax=Pluteus cervinus TaxID=181527 RepID=A0ACD3B953_9AGAR|nr:hypothetical protein BDN72DRAFT_788870 [Pluteus cervinus]